MVEQTPPPPHIPHVPANPLKSLVIGRVRAVFNDTARGERPVQRRYDGLFGPQAVAWRVHGDVTTMMVGGVSALLLQMLHPKVLAGVWDHSNFRADMLGRLRRTARFIALTTYGGADEAEAAIERVRRIHVHVGGTLPDGTPYRADDPDLLRWVHITETWAFLEGWRLYAEPGLTRADADRYFAEMAEIAAKLGAPDVPRSQADTLAALEAERPKLVVDARTREVVRILQSPPGLTLAARPVQNVTFQAAVDLLPRWAREMHGLPHSRLARPVVAGGTHALARTLRWAFR